MTDVSAAVLGLDTSNYRTSLAIVSLKGDILFNVRTLLPVKPGERGLRQSDAVYAHLKQVKAFIQEASEVFRQVKLEAVCASTAPRDRKDSYMPVFEVGDTMGRLLAAGMGIPFFATDHQHGHLRSAQAGTELEGKKSFLALHLSGGTTDLLCEENGRLTELGSSLDLHAGQLMDRAGVAMGLSFPAGPEMEALALRGQSRALLGCSMEDGDLSCHLSGAEAQIMRWIQKRSLSPENIAREIFDLLARTGSRMLTAGAEKTGCRETLVFGGIASSGLYRDMLCQRIRNDRSGVRLSFGAPEFCGDNAVGVALIGTDRILMHGGHL